jgi:tRNA threonylcarbamoyladenosine biosynthesis protein TsaE
MRVTTHSEAETERLAGRIAAGLRRGDVVRLTGGIGSGKTAFARGVARALGITEPVVSPSFVLQAVYDGRLTLHHFDFYRLTSEAQARELAVEEFAGEGLVLVEWADRFPDAIRPPHLTVAFELGEADDERHLTLWWEGAARELPA